MGATSDATTHGSAATAEWTSRSIGPAASAGWTRTAGPHNTGGTGSEGVSIGEMVEGPGFEDEDLYIEWAEEGHVQR